MNIAVQYPLHLLPDTVGRLFVYGLGSNLTMLLPRTISQFAKLAKAGETAWKEKAGLVPGQEGRPLRLGTGPSDPMVRLSSKEYSNSISTVSESPAGQEFASFRVTASDRQADVIEQGSPGGRAIDLHQVLGYAPKARQGKKGKYLHIPFRHATTAPGGPGGQRFQASGARPGHGVLTSGIIRVMQEKRKYLITSSYHEPSIHNPHQLVERNRYTKNPGRLTAAEIEHVNQLSRSHKITPVYAKRLEGLMRTGQKGHGKYLTIRTLSEANPEGWRISPYPAQKLAEQTAKDMSSKVPGWFDEALRADALDVAKTVLGKNL